MQGQVRQLTTPLTGRWFRQHHLFEMRSEPWTHDSTIARPTYFRRLRDVSGCERRPKIHENTYRHIGITSSSPPSTASSSPTVLCMLSNIIHLNRRRIIRHTARHTLRQSLRHPRVLHGTPDRSKYVRARHIRVRGLTAPSFRCLCNLKHDLGVRGRGPVRSWVDASVEH